jgi:fructose-1,6-bisphosphatase/inositol monophosphatase family enzyme
MTADASLLLEPIRKVHDRIRDAVVRACEQEAVVAMAEADDSGAGDTIYAVDRISEHTLIELLEAELASRTTIVLIAEGLSAGAVTLPRGADAADAAWRVIVDPIDGTRGLMYQKRSGWILTGIAPNRGPGTTMADIELAVQTEIPLVKQHLSDTVWAVRGRGAHAERTNRLTGERRALVLRPSTASTIAHGFAMVSRFFPGAREELAAIDEEIVRRALGPVQRGKAHCFEDQYVSSGGQLYELMAGHDRFVADLRPLMEPLLAARGLALGICCHPYDLCTELIARELGVIVTDERGEPLRAPLAVEPEVTWVGYANERIRAQIEPLLHDVLEKRRLLVMTDDATAWRTT